MKYAVMGAGAVGCYYGGMLALAGHEVTLIGRPTHVKAISAHGLQLERRTGHSYIRLKASTSPEAVRGADVVLFCVKSTDTELAGLSIAPFLDKDAIVLSLQNGIDNAERLRTVLKQTVAPAVVYVATEMAGPGHVRHHGRGEILLARIPGGEAITSAFVEAHIPLEMTGDVKAAQWSKLIVNCAYNALSAITQLPYGELVACQGVEQVLRDIVDECLAVARADGVIPEANAWEAVSRISRTMPTQKSSTAQDLIHRRRTEIDHLNGYVVDRGVELGIPTPVNRVLHTLVKLLESASTPST